MEKEKKKKKQQHDRKPAPCGQRVRKGVVYKVESKNKKPQITTSLLHPSNTE